MSAEQVRQVTEAESRKVAEESREAEWKQPSFMREMFLGNFRIDLIHPYPSPKLDRPEFVEFYAKLEAFLRDEVDPAAIDEGEDYPEHVIDGLRRLGAFGLKIPKEYGGRGFDQNEYAQVMELLGSYDGNLVALLSAHQSIGVPQPIKLFGTEAQKKKYLPQCAKGVISAFALTEPNVGSDPARLSTTAVLDGDDYVLNGKKLWCTNGTIAKLLVVMASHPGSNKISAFVVETEWPGVKVERRCHFMGLKALANGVITFDNVRIPRENLIGAEGRGLKIALTTLNDGRLSIPNACVGVGKICLRVVRAVGGRAGAVGQGDRQARGDRAEDRLHRLDHLRHGVDRQAGERHGQPRRSRPAPRGRRLQGVEHRSGLEDHRRDHADPRRARLREGVVARGAR